MKIEDFETVCELLATKERVEQALKDIEQSDIDSEHWCYLSKCRDGSGKITDLTGCNVCSDVVYAVEKVLLKKINEIDDNLIALGVEV